VSETNAAGPPDWVCKRDGRREPFDADKICQSLFAASETLGLANAFLARELTDAVVHFVAADAGEAPPTTAQIAEQVVKVVRELGQPALAQAFAAGAGRHPAAVPAVESTRGNVEFTFSADQPPDEVVRQCLRTYTERAVVSRDLVSAEKAGLLRLAGMDTPRSLTRCVLGTHSETAIDTHYSSELTGACDVAGQGLVLDGPEWHATDPGDKLRREFLLTWLAHLPALSRRHVVVNLNAAQPPAWARRRDAGPLFADEAATLEPVSLPLLDNALEVVPPAGAWNARWDWHLQARDFAAGAHRERLRRVAERASAGSPIAFVLDRPRRPVALAEGMDRSRPAVLMEVGVDLGAFLRLPEVASNGDAFREKLSSLARMAVSAGVQKRRYLRRHAEGTLLARGFLLDRARLAVVPLGLDTVVWTLTGQGPAASPSALGLARQLLQVLQDQLQLAGRDAHLEVGIDSPGPGLSELLAPGTLATAGLSLADAETTPEQQLSAAGALHAVTGQGTARVLLPDGAAPTPDALVDLLQYAWRRTDVVRVIFFRPGIARANAI
jgi:hypothetical protein